VQEILMTNVPEMLCREYWLFVWLLAAPLAWVEKESPSQSTDSLTKLFMVDAWVCEVWRFSSNEKY
jgi:hypothetical protein